MIALIMILGYDSDDEAFWFWLLFDDGLSDLFWLFKDDDWHCDSRWLFLVSPLLNLTCSFGVEEIDLCLDSSENFEVSLLVYRFEVVIKRSLYSEVCLHLQKSFPPNS